ncbi:hypothetical protein SEA_CAMBIARE_38 [Mycobacterium phage Cambiare]|uniref:Uncharacterized protein n=1 Tax=Mycobacterium phage Cambiare TaxID=1647305 RepID=A0A0F6WE75_9CAUD|nr:RNA-binding protein [Mycobacterium phage Cambiare]AKF14540.1 hypothetical protein SEA_CAMBIARE_38 [Mycobacterium phage Cambiare]
MTTHEVTVEAFEYERVRVNQRNALIVYEGGRDYQAGDALRVWRKDDARYSVEREITHVGHNTTGVDSRYVVLSLADPRVKNLTTRLESAVEEQHRLARSNAALRGRVRRLAGR